MFDSVCSCLYWWACMYLYMRVEARGQCRMSSSLTHHLKFWRVSCRITRLLVPQPDTTVYMSMQLHLDGPLGSELRYSGLHRPFIHWDIYLDFSLFCDMYEDPRRYLFSIWMFNFPLLVNFSIIKYHTFYYYNIMICLDKY